MAFTAGATVITGDLVTAAMWNNYMGAAGSIDYLKTEADKIDDVSHAEPARAIGTVYQNTSGKIRYVAVTFTCDLGEDHHAWAYIGAASPPTTIVGGAGVTNPDGGVATIMNLCVSFIVLLDYYYEVDAGGGDVDPTLVEWHEWDLH